MYVDTVYGFYGYSFLCLVGCFSMINWTPTILFVLYAYVSYFCICTRSAQLSMFHMERHSRNTLILLLLLLLLLIIIIIIIIITILLLLIIIIIIVIIIIVVVVFVIIIIIICVCMYVRVCLRARACV